MLAPSEGNIPPLSAVQPPQQPTQELSAWEMRISHATASCCGDPLAINDALWSLLEERAKEIIASPRRITQQRQAIHAVARSLGLKLTTADVNDLYEQLDTTFAAYEPGIEPGGEFIASSQAWLLDGIFLVGLNLLVGMPGASKSSLLVALIGAYLNGQSTFLQRKLLSGLSSSVLIVGTDQDRQQWGYLLATRGLAEETGRIKRDDRPDDVKYKLHPRIHLETSGGGFRLDADGMRWIRDWCQQNPGGLLVVDSFSAVLPPGIKEADESAGRLMRQIEMARQGNPCIVTHHTNKQSAMSGELGVYSGSGSGSIDRAVSRHIGLAYEFHIEAGKERLHTESPRRILTSQKRGAANQRLIIETGPNNTWDYIATAAEDRELKRQAEDGDPTERLKGWKLAVYKALTDDWQTTSAVRDALPKGKREQDRQVRRVLRELQEASLIEEERDAIAEARWRLPPV